MAGFIPARVVVLVFANPSGEPVEDRIVFIRFGVDKPRHYIFKYFCRILSDCRLFSRMTAESIHSTNNGQLTTSHSAAVFLARDSGRF